MDELTEIALDFAISRGACAAGIATTETLAGGPPSADLTYVLPEAKSAVSLAVPIEQKLIPPYFAKQDHIKLENAAYQAYTLSSGISLELATFFRMKGIAAVPLAGNRHYRLEPPHTMQELLPDISHKYLAVRSGVGHFGFSGNVLTKSHGAAVMLGSVVTAAELDPTDPLPEDENYCDECKICVASCASGFMDPSERDRVTLGGVEFSFSKRRSYDRCVYVCGGFTGLHKSGKWSTWSPGRFPIPEDDEEFAPAVQKAFKPYSQWPKIEGGHYHCLINAKIRTTCAHCQFICHPDRKERDRRYKLLLEGGVVVQTPEGPLEAVPPEEARKRLDEMNFETRALYEVV
jgi:epoxyqueuosine reductase